MKFVLLDVLCIFRIRAQQRSARHKHPHCASICICNSIFLPQDQMFARPTSL